MFPEIFILQYAVLTMSSIALVIYIGYVWPYNSEKMSRMELMNEIVIIFLMYHIVCFTDFVPSLETRHKLGYSIIVCILLNLIIYYAVLSFFECRDLLRRLRRIKAIKESERKAQAAKESRQLNQRKSPNAQQHSELRQVNQQRLGLQHSVAGRARAEELEDVQEKSCESSNSSGSESEIDQSVLKDESRSQARSFSLPSAIVEEKKEVIPLPAASASEDSILNLVSDNGSIAAMAPTSIVEHRNAIKNSKKYAAATGQIYKPSKQKLLRDDKVRDTIDQERFEKHKKLQRQPKQEREEENSHRILDSLLLQEELHLATMALKRLEESDQLEDASVEDLYKKYPFTMPKSNATMVADYPHQSSYYEQTAYRGSTLIHGFTGQTSMGMYDQNQIVPQRPQPVFLGNNLALQTRPSIAEKRRKMDSFNREYCRRPY